MITNRQRVIRRLDALPPGAMFTINDIEQEFNQSTAPPSHRLIYQILCQYPRARIVTRPEPNQRGRIVWGII